MPKVKNINPEIKIKIYTLACEGESNYCIAEILGVSKNTAKLWSNESNRLDEISQTESKFSCETERCPWS